MGSEWQPIDSAPKDGTRILVFEGAGSPVCGKVYVGFWYEGDEQASLPYSDKCWSDTADPSYERSPTHWMPLPEPPGS